MKEIKQNDDFIASHQRIISMLVIDHERDETSRNNMQVPEKGFKPYTKTFRHGKNNPPENINCTNRYESDEEEINQLNIGIGKNQQPGQHFKNTRIKSRPNISTLNEPEKQHFAKNKKIRDTEKYRNEKPINRFQPVIFQIGIKIPVSNLYIEKRIYISVRSFNMR